MIERPSARPGKLGGITLVAVSAIFLTYACAYEVVPEQMSSGAEDHANAASDSPDSSPRPETASEAEGSAAQKPYSIECDTDADGKRTNCLVDKATFIGWRTFHGFCHVCHAQDAVGSTFAPSLVDRMQDIDYDLFIERTGNGYTGQVGVMPPWKDNPNVSKKYDELFAYLKARADGALAPGRPKKQPKK